jgi:phosphatidylglycerophosphatase A
MPRAKESSDVISPPVVEAAHVVVPGRRTAGDYLALAVATCGVGLIPIAPGTWGAGVGIAVYLAIVSLAGAIVGKDAIGGGASVRFHVVLSSLLFVFIFAISIAGTWAATRAEKLLGKKDPGAVVVDEVAGQLVAFLFVPWDTGWLTLASGFVAFRVFDIWKPYPIRRLEALGGGLGVMADDLLAGFYAAVVMSLISLIYLF